MRSNNTRCPPASTMAMLTGLRNSFARCLLTSRIFLARSIEMLTPRCSLLILLIVIQSSQTETTLASVEYLNQRDLFSSIKDLGISAGGWLNISRPLYRRWRVYATNPQNQGHYAM